MRLAEKLPAYTVAVDSWLAFNAPEISRHEITEGRHAWAIATRSGVTRDAYDTARDIVDAHIQTALEHIFPRAVFRDAKRY